MGMKEIRLHGRGGQGVVKAAQTIVQTVVDTGGYAHFIPFFGVERKGSPVYGYLRIDDKDIRLKTQVYTPAVIIIMDDTLLDIPQTFDGLQDGGTVVLNTSLPMEALNLPAAAGRIALVDAGRIAQALIRRDLPNTAMLGAFAKVTGLVDWEAMKRHIESNFDAANRDAAVRAYEEVSIILR
jgi:2-oxoacid:acceptor oxidoreductase gamma subunit (pyruvate/2-ketoisovalerate family)